MSQWQIEEKWIWRGSLSEILFCDSSAQWNSWGWSWILGSLGKPTLKRVASCPSACGRSCWCVAGNPPSILKTSWAYVVYKWIPLCNGSSINIVLKQQSKILSLVKTQGFHAPLCIKNKISNITLKYLGIRVTVKLVVLRFDMFFPVRIYYINIFTWIYLIFLG